jgi:hypothetical protein
MSETLQNDNATDDPMVLEQVGTTLLHLTGNVLDGVASSNMSNVETNDAKVQLTILNLI